MRTEGKIAHNKKPNGTGPSIVERNATTKKRSKVIAETQTATQGIEEEKKEGPRTSVILEK